MDHLVPSPLSPWIFHMPGQICSAVSLLICENGIEMILQRGIMISAFQVFSVLHKALWEPRLGTMCSSAKC